MSTKVVAVDVLFRNQVINMGLYIATSDFLACEGGQR
jgi:hypothetical protein